MTRKSFLLLYIFIALLFSFFEATGQYLAGTITIFIMLADILGAAIMSAVSPRFCDYFFSRTANWSDTL